MIAVANNEGQMLKWLGQGVATREPPRCEASQEGLLSDFNNSSNTFGFHSSFGFIGAAASAARMRSQKLNRGQTSGDWLFRFSATGSGSSLNVAALENCSVEPISEGVWRLISQVGSFILTGTAAEVAPARLPISIQTETKDDDRKVAAGVIIAFLLFLSLNWAIRGEKTAEAPVILEQVQVKILPEKQKAVKVPALDALPQQIQTQDRVARKAIAQDLGFLGMLGKKNLTKALGGAPTQLKDASAGAGAGGTQGSGGELLVGLGQGVKRTTVGNSGTVGLGGVGTKGAGGGNGGYGNSMVGSGGGRALSAMPVSQDIVLDGGLDRSVIQATIAKYLSQVRACYEAGLAKTPGISGTVTMQFEIGASGNLNFARVGKSSLGDAGVESCISARMMDWKFPKPLGGVNVKVAYPFLLRPST